MKFFTSFCVFLSLSLSTWATPLGLSPNQECQLIDHLVEVNKEWLKYSNDWPDLYRNVTFKKDDERIQLHLQLVAEILNQRNTNGLNDKQIQNRLAQIETLQEYYEAGIFPKNTGHQQRQPYFIDNFGTACAVGYLVIQDGHEDFAQKIQSENNFAYIHEMSYPQLNDWATANGLTKDELAWIQPGYQPADRDFQDVGNGLGVDGEVTVMKADPNDEMLYLVGDFDSVDGITANNIIAWDGSDWHTLAGGVEGTINDIAFHNSDVIIGGNFTIPGIDEAENIARWNGEEWLPLQTGNMEGEVKAVEVVNSTLFVGGDFQKINGAPMRTFARYHFWQNQWTNTHNYWDSDNNLTVEAPHAMEVNGSVTALEVVGNYILVGGDFNMTAPVSSNSNVNQVEANHLAYWSLFNNNWEAGLMGDHPAVASLAYIDGDIYVGTGTVGEDKCIAILKGGIWVENGFAIESFTPFGDNTIHGFVETSDEGILIYGGFNFFPIVGTFGAGTATMSPEGYADGYAGFNGTVTSVVEFQEKLFFAGDFTQINQDAINGLTQLSILTNDVEPQKEDIQIYQSGQEIMIDYPNLNQEAQIIFYNITGQKLGEMLLSPYQLQASYNAQNWSTGTYIYQMKVNNSMIGGKFFVKEY